MRIELVFFPGCPNADAIRRLVCECMAALGINEPIGETVGDFPSPTLMIEGVDVMSDETQVRPGRSCRLDLPTRDRVLLALRAHRGN